MLGFGATGQFAIGQVDTTTAGSEFIGPDKYMQALAEPVRFRRGLGAPAQAFVAFNPLPVVSFAWFEALAEPVRKPPRSPAAMAPVHFWQPAPSPFVATGWFAPLSEPVRKRPALPAGHKQFFAGDTTVIPLQTGLLPWFAPLSEPVRTRPGLAARLQQFLAAPSQLRPTPTTTGVLNALETKDVFQGGLRAWDRVVSGEVGVMEFSRPTAEIGIAPYNAPSGEAAVIVQGTAVSGGSAVTPAFAASISIRIV
jgi:hypothetical protein